MSTMFGPKAHTYGPLGPYTPARIHFFSFSLKPKGAYLLFSIVFSKNAIFLIL
jgi:hypothetical protein